MGFGNSQRGVVVIRAVPRPGEQTPGPWKFRLRMNGVAEFQELISTPTYQPTIEETFGIIDRMAKGKGNYKLKDLLNVLLAGFQEFHSDTVRTKADVEDIIEAVGGLTVLERQLTGIADELKPDPEDIERREQEAQRRKAGNPRRRAQLTRSS